MNGASVAQLIGAAAAKRQINLFFSFQFLQLLKKWKKRELIAGSLALLGAEELIYLRVMSRWLLCREEIPFRSATALLHFILLAHSLVEWQEAKKED